MTSDPLKESRILVIDDEPLNLDIVKEILNDAGYRNVTLSSRPGDALDLFMKEEFDLILLDLLMPDMSGKDFAHRLQKFRPDHGIPILVLTAVTDKKITQYMLTYGGAVDYLTKPFEGPELLARINNILTAKMNRDHLKKLVKKRTQDVWKAHLSTINSLARAAEFKDNETGAHIKRIGLMSRSIAEAMGWDVRRARLLQITAPLHDLGKVGIADHILLKNGPLDPDERKIMEKHTIIGALLLLESGSCDNEMLQMAAGIALNHHEKWDGQGGYPRGISGDRIPLEARIVSCVDVFDALLSRRPYKEPWEMERAIDYIRSNSGKQFDPEIVKVFLRHVEDLKSIREEHEDDLEEIINRSRVLEQKIMDMENAVLVNDTTGDSMRNLCPEP